MSNTPTFTDEAAQAFVEDLASVFAKHGLQITSWEAISAEPLDPDSKIVAINKDGDIRFLTEPPQPPKLRPLKWYEDPSVPRQLPEPEFRAFAPIPVNAHGLLAAAARIATIRAEQGEHAIELSDAAFDAMLAHLDQPPQTNTQLVALLRRRPVWDKQEQEPTHG